MCKKKKLTSKIGLHTNNLMKQQIKIDRETEGYRELNKKTTKNV